MRSPFKTGLEKGLHALGISIESEGIERLENYYLDLRKWNKKVNLIAKSVQDNEVIEKHFLDSLTLLPFLERSKSHLVDIGTGGGFPGLVCKAARPELDITLVEPRKKRCSFLKHIVRSLELESVKIHSVRIEELPELPSDESITHVTSRAVTEVGPFLEMVEVFSSTRPSVLLMKGPKWQSELKKAENMGMVSRFDLETSLEISLPFSGAKRSILHFTFKE